MAMARIILGSLLIAVASMAADAAPGTPPAKAATRAATQPATGPSTQKADYYAMTPEAFFKLPAVNAKIPKDPAKTMDFELLDAAVFHATNVARAKHDAKPVKFMGALGAAASGHSREMAELNYFGHVSPKEGNKTLTHRARQVGLADVPMGENIHARQTLNNTGEKLMVRIVDGQKFVTDAVTGKPVGMATYAELANAAVEAWLNSPGHRATMLSPDFTRLGVGTARGPLGEGKQDSIYFTQNFARTNKP